MGNIFTYSNNADWTDGQQIWTRSDGKKTSWQIDNELKEKRARRIKHNNKIDPVIRHARYVR